MAALTTLTFGPDPAGISQAAALLRAGQLVAFPTETVYGLGGDATSGAAVAGIFAAKNRPEFNPLIVHVPSVESARQYIDWNETAQRLADAFWPGPLTLVLPLAPNHGIASLVTAGLPTLAIRVPAQPTARALLQEVGRPIAAPSANPSGRISPTTAAHVMSGLSGRISGVLDDGPCNVGLESTIVGLSKTPTLLRPGGLSAEAIAACLGFPLAHSHAADGITAPGQLSSHYAPRSSLRLNATNPETGEVYLGFGPYRSPHTLSESGDLTEAAAALFDMLHRLDALKQPIAVAPIPDIGLGVAINDRLRRAAAPRP